MTKFHILTDKGFLSPDSSRNHEILLYNGLYKKYTRERNKNIFSKKVKLTLYTGTEVYIDPDKKIKGLTYSSGEIKNELEILNSSEFKIDDYVYTPYINVSYYPTKTQINLTDYLSQPIKDKHRVYYISKNIYKEYENSGFTFIDMLSVLSDKSLNSNLNEKVLTYLKSKNIDISIEDNKNMYLSDLLFKCTDTLSSTLSINKRLMDFIIISILRGDIQHVSLKSNLILKTISYKFNKENFYHQSMYNDLLLFLRGLDIGFEEKEYDFYYYINLSCEPLINFLESFKINHFKDLSKFSSVDCRYFILTLYKYTNNSYYSNYDTFLVLKEYAYYCKIVLGYTEKIHANYDSLYPINSFILEEIPLTVMDLPDVIQLDDGYLTRIVKTEYETTQGEDDFIDTILPVY